MGWLIFVGVVTVILVLLRRYGIDPNAPKPPATDPDRELKDEDFLARIREMTCAEDVVVFAESFNSEGVVADALVAKAKEFKDELDRDDWLNIFDSIDDFGDAAVYAAMMAEIEFYRGSRMRWTANQSREEKACRLPR
jgi:hypothetical protein